MIAERAAFAVPLAEEFPQPSLNDVRRYLRSIGAQPVGPGRGDHEKWKLPNGALIVLNSAKRQRKELDFASLKSLAASLGLTPFELTLQRYCP